MPTAFPFPCDWTSSYQETRAYLTDVLVARDLTEQRRMLRGVARRSYSFKVATEIERETALLDSLLYRGLQDQMAVPYWPGVTFLTAAAGLGATTLNAEVTGHEFWADGYAMLWRDPFVYELVQIDTVGGSSLTLVAGTAGAWPQHSVLVPCHLGRLAVEFGVSRMGGVTLTDANVAFSIDDPAAPATPVIWNDAIGDMLVTGMPDGLENSDEQWTRETWTIDPLTAPLRQFTRRAQPVLQWGHALKLLSLVDSKALWDWYDGVVGQWRPSWVPDYVLSLKPLGTIAAAATSFTIAACGYSTYQFPHTARRWLGIMQGPGQLVKRYVANAVDNLDGTETIDLASAIGFDVVPEDGTMVYLLRYSRLVADEMAVEWVGPGLATCKLQLMDLPFEIEKVTEVPLLASGTTLFAPSLGAPVTTPALGPVAVLTAPSLAGQLNGAHITSTATLYVPTLTQESIGATLASGAVLYTPSVGQVIGATLPLGSTLYAPTVA